jgi:DNA-binding transcriptional MerR regulator
MSEEQKTVILWRVEHRYLTLGELAQAAGLHPELVKRFVSFGLIEPAARSGSEFVYEVSAVERLRCVVRLRNDLGVNTAGAAVILEMRDRIRMLQDEISKLRTRLDRERQVHR